VQNAGGAEIPGAVNFVAAIGTIDVVPSATNTGAFKWSLFYIPLDDAAVGHRSLTFLRLTSGRGERCQSPRATREPRRT
jgi:hypothetical protein